MKPTKSVESASAATRAWWRCPGIVYFLAVGEPPIAIKIGMLAITPKTTKRSAVVRRLSHIQSSNHEPVQLIGVIYFSDGDYPSKQAEDRERELHLEFERLGRFKPNTRGAEWFSSSPELLSRIKQIAEPPENHGLPRSVAVSIRSRGDERSGR